MINQTLINSNIEHCHCQLTQKQTTAIKDLYQLDHFFTQDLLEKLVGYAEQASNWQKVELQEYTSRYSIPWDADSVIEETYLIFDGLTNSLSDLFGKSLKLTGIQLWQDNEGYTIAPHVDNERVGYSIQIYLTEGIDHLGTHFFSDTTVEIPYIVNTGYVTSMAQRIKHGMTKSVPKNHVRYSVYAIWA